MQTRKLLYRFRPAEESGRGPEQFRQMLKGSLRIVGLEWKRLHRRRQPFPFDFDSQFGAGFAEVT